MTQEAREAVMTLSKSIGTRFQSKGAEFVRQATRLILTAATTRTVLREQLREVIIHLDGDVDIDKLEQQFPNLNTKCSAAKDLVDVIDLVKELPEEGKLMISEVLILLNILVCMAASSATEELLRTPPVQGLVEEHHVPGEALCPHHAAFPQEIDQRFGPQGGDEAVCASEGGKSTSVWIVEKRRCLTT